MRIRRPLLAVAMIASMLPGASAANESPAKSLKKVYGEWRILVKPDKGQEYNALIANRGLPLFRQAGGRMVGWWNTLIGNLYEQVTIWEYDDMAAFERAIEILGKEPKFAEFVSRRDPLLQGEQNRFLTLADGAEEPVLSEPSRFVIHEIHRVSQKKLPAYLNFMSHEGLKLLKAHGFRPVGPWMVEVGPWSEVTYLFRFNSLADRARLIREFSTHADTERYSAAIANSVEEITTRMLFPATSAAAPVSKTAASRNFPIAIPSTRLSHVEQLAEGVFVTGFADRYGSANCGWVRLKEETLLVDLPRGVEVSPFLNEVEKIVGQPVRKLALTQFQRGDEQTIAALVEQGVREIFTSPVIRNAVTAAWKGTNPPPIKAPIKGASGAATSQAQLIPADDVMEQGAAVFYLPERGILFAGPLVVNGPRTPLAGSDTERWVNSLQELQTLKPTQVVPGRGSWNGPEIIARQHRFLAELRRQIAYSIAQGHPKTSLKRDVHIPAGDLVWMPYDTPSPEDIEYLYRELTAPTAPFHGHPPSADDSQPHALVLVGDQPHEPGHIIDGLTPVFTATHVTPHFTVDVASLTAENLAKVRLLVILRDGLQRPTDDESTHFVWMTPQQGQAVVQFVNGGGAFLNLHNSMGLYPENGPYLKLVGGRYIGHGPLERFRVEVVDATHPITRGVHDFWVADEQHTPPYDVEKVHLLLRNRSDDGKVAAAAGWAYEPGHGRLCHLAPGHTRESLLHPMYQRLMRNAVDWCLRREVK